MQLRALALALVCLVPLSTAAHAGALDPALVDRSATWVLHVDFEALARSALLDNFHRAGMKIENEVDCDEIRKFGLDPFADVHSLTMYGFEPSEGVVTVVLGGPKMSEAWRRLAAKSTASTTAGRETLAIESRHGQRFVAFAPPKSGVSACRAVVATTTAALAKALTVLDGEAASLVSAESGREAKAPVLRPRPASSALVYSTSVAGEPFAKIARQAPYLSRALGLLTELADIGHKQEDAFASPVRALEYELVESGGELRTRVVIETESASAADELERLLRARIARTSTEDTRPVVARLLAALTIDSPASQLRLSYRYGAASFVADVVLSDKGEASGPGH